MEVKVDEKLNMNFKDKIGAEQRSYEKEERKEEGEVEKEDDEAVIKKK